MVQLKVKIFNF